MKLERRLAERPAGVFSGGLRMAIHEGPPGPAAMGFELIFAGGGEFAKIDGDGLAALQAIGAALFSLAGELGGECE